MKQAMGWWFPDHEQHLIEWMQHPKSRMVLNGRQAYQGKKQLAALAAVGRIKQQLRTAVDVGAHVGLWSYNLAPAFQRVVAFEPVADHRDCFVQNVPFGNVELEPFALGAEARSVSIASDPKSTGDSRVAGDGEIPMRTLDSFELDGVDLLKIDCEGYEENVVRGAEQTITRDRPVIVVEQKRDMANRFGLPSLGAVAFLQGLGYRVEQEIGGDYLMVYA